MESEALGILGAWELGDVVCSQQSVPGAWDTELKGSRTHKDPDPPGVLGAWLLGHREAVAVGYPNAPGHSNAADVQCPARTESQTHT